MLIANYVNTVPKILIISLAPVLRCLWSIIYKLDTTHQSTKTNLKVLILKIDPNDKFRHQQDPEYIYKIITCEFWWNLFIQIATKLKSNNPDIVVWDRGEKIYKIIEISCPPDVNITKKVEESLSKYGPLIRNLQIV